MDTMQSDELWERVLARDPAADGRFVYGVRSTGVSCRPTCPSRRPLRRHVQFFAHPAGAERAGFRPCRRCHGQPQPDWPRLLQKACELLAADTRPTLAEVAAELGVGPFQLQRRFKDALGITPRDFAAARRAGRLKALLARHEPVASALYEAGYGFEQPALRTGRRGARHDAGHLSPWRSQDAHSLHGRPLAARPPAGGGHGAGRMQHQAGRQRRRPGGGPPPRVPACGPRSGPREAVAGRHGTSSSSSPASGPASTFRSTSRARRSSAASGITCGGFRIGQTKSYGDIARAIGQPGAARAVARACASNHAALVIPCHRVVPGDGKPGGYHWGANRKRKLLEIERSRHDWTAGRAGPHGDEFRPADVHDQLAASGASGCNRRWIAARNVPQLQQLLQEIDEALERFAKGSYGFCETCGDPIEVERLEVDPLIRFCLDHLTPHQARALEQDLQLASRVQLNLLPPTNLALDGWQTAYHYEPLSTVSGDYVDIVRPSTTREDCFFSSGTSPARA